MKINILLPGLSLSGGERVVLEYGDRLTQIGHSVVFYISKKPYDFHTNKSAYKNTTIWRWIAAQKRLKNINKCLIVAEQLYPNAMIKVVNEFNNATIRNADALIATAWVTAFTVFNLEASKGEKFYFIQGYEIWDNKELGEQSYKLPLHHIVIAKWIDKILKEQLGCEPADIVYNGIDTDFFHPAPKKEDHEKIRCLMLYHTLPKKGVGDGVEAFKKAKEKYPNLSLTMFGMYKKPKIECLDHYYQNPKREELRNLYQQADLFIFPSREEGWGLTPLEAMACGCPVVGTNVGCMTELGIDGKNVLLSEPGDVNGMAMSIKRLVRNPELMKKLSDNGLKTVSELSWELSADEILNILKRKNLR